MPELDVLVLTGEELSPYLGLATCGFRRPRVGFDRCSSRYREFDRPTYLSIEGLEDWSSVPFRSLADYPGFEFGG